MNKTTIDIKGMHCRSCEILVEDELLKVSGVRHVVVSNKKGTAKIFFKGNLNKNEIENAVKEAGYSLGKDEKPLFSKNRKDYIDLATAGIVILFLFYLANTWGLFNTGPSNGNFSSLPVVFLIGLTAGLSTCMALVGGLVLGASARFAEKHPDASPIQKFKPHLFFNIGRIVSFFILGGIIGYGGSFFQMSPLMLGILTIIVGFVMFILGAQLVELSPKLSSISITLPKSLGRFLGIKEQNNKEYSHKNAALLGALTFFLPCGFTQAMQLFAISTGNPVTGALTMGVFAIGTAPGLLGIGGLTSVIKGAIAKMFFKYAGVVVILLAFFNISNGLTLTGFSINTLPVLEASTNNAQTEEDPNVVIENGFQIVRMNQETSGYNPDYIAIKKGVPVKWIINSKDSNTCASVIALPKLGIRQGLQSGENVIEFTPQELGEIRFSCIMGMYSGSFNVIENKTGPDNGNIKQTVNFSENKEVISTITPEPTINIENAQVIRAIYTQNTDINPNRFTVKAGLPVQFIIEAREDGYGCMGSIFIPRLAKKPEILTQGESLVFNFTPQSPGRYPITCAMGSPRGEILVN